MKTYQGEVKARIIEARFALSGKIASAGKKLGDKVAKWDLIASLDRKILQTELDRQLADFEKTRADFEIFAGKVGEPTDQVNKYLKVEKQAELNASVKEVELAKARLDQCDLFSPVNGIIIDDSGLAPGLNIAPAGSAVKIVDTDCLYFEIQITQKEVKDFESPRKCEVEIEGMKEKISSASSPVHSDGKSFTVALPLPASSKVLLGMKGKAKF